MDGKIKVGVWGLGRAGHAMHVEELKMYPDMFEAVAGCDIAPERREAAKEKFPGLRLYAEGKDMLADPELEMITIATRSPQHVEHAIAALETGHYVVVDKPIACSYEDGLKLYEASKRYPGKLFIRHNRRFETAFSHVQEIIASGKLGEIFEVKLARHSFVWRKDWQTIRELGGGQLLNWGPHLIDHALRFLESPVKEVWSDLKLINARGDAEDHVKIILKGENSRVVEIEISGGIAKVEPIYIVYGTRGSLLSYDEKRIKLRYLRRDITTPQLEADPGLPDLHGDYGVPVPAGGWIEDDIAVAPESCYNIYSMWPLIYRAIREGGEYPVTMEQALEVVRITSLIQKTAIDKLRK